MKDRDFLNIPLEVKKEDIQEDGTFKGYGSLFDHDPDSYGDIISKGAFKASLSKGGRNKTGVAMLWQHRSDQIPGVWTALLEDSKGLAVEGQLALKTTLGNDVYEIMKLGAETQSFKLGLSIGYDPVKYEILIDEESKRRTRDLKEVDLWEISFATFPAKIGAIVSTVKTAIEDARTERELEKALRDAGNLSKSCAQYIVKLCRSSLRDANNDNEQNEQDKGLSTILEALQKTNNNLFVPQNGERDGLFGILNTLKQTNIG